MSKTQKIGISAVVAAMLVVVGIPVLKSAYSAPGIAVHEPAPPRAFAPSVPLPSSARPLDTGGSTESGAPTASKLAGPTGAIAGTTAATPVVSATGTEEGTRTEPVQKPEVVVQVAGAVKRPGVYHLAVGARNDDAVTAAGGLAPAANAASVNLAARAMDGSQLYVKTVKEQPQGGVSEEDAALTAPGTGSARKLGALAARHSAASGAGKRASTGKPAKLKDPAEGKVNINTASAADLQRIPNIGPAMAEKVIAYRQENHGFQSIEDLMQVSGIGAKKFAKMAPYVKIH